MCNRIHADSLVPKRKRGKGWKLFAVTLKGETRTLVRKEKYEKIEGKIEWLYEQEGGFCFFFSKREAIKAINDWWPYKAILLPIYFEEAFARHMEVQFTGRPVDMGLCKSFTILTKDMRNSARVDRKIENKNIRYMLEKVNASPIGRILIYGPPGIGKTISTVLKKGIEQEEVSPVVHSDEKGREVIELIKICNLKNKEEDS